MNKIDIKSLESRLINSSKTSNILNKNSNKDFNEVLNKIQNKDKEIKFSKHALERLNNRDIDLTTEELLKLKSAFHKAEDKGVKDALILMGDKAFIANIHNKTIITTVNKEQLKENVFTNIDGAVII